MVSLFCLYFLSGLFEECTGLSALWRARYWVQSCRAAIWPETTPFVLWECFDFYSLSLPNRIKPGWATCCQRQKSRKRPLLIFNTYVSVSRCEIALSRDSPPIGSLIRREILQTLISQKKILLPCQGLKCYLLLERPLDLVLRAFHWKRSDARAVAKILQNGQLSFAWSFWTFENIFKAHLNDEIKWYPV